MRLSLCQIPAAALVGLALSAAPGALASAPVIYHSLEEASAAAAKDDRPILLDFYTQW